jgi:hypothetical protein
VIQRGLTGSVLVLLGGLVVSTLPGSAPVVGFGPLALMRQTEIGRMAGLTVVLLGLGLLAHAWLTLCRGVARLGAERWSEGVDLARFAAVVWSAPLLVAPPLFSRDGWSYAAQGALADAGYSPYTYGPEALVPQDTWFSVHLAPVVQAVDPMWMDTATPYGPLPLFFGKIFANFTGNPWVLVVGHRLLALVGLALLAWAVPRLARWVGANPALSVSLVIVSPLMLANGVGGLHNDLLMVGLMAAALVVGAERGWLWGAMLAGGAAAVKVPGGLVCVAIALVTLPAGARLAQRLAQLAKVGAAALATLFGLGVVTGLGNGWIAALAVPGEINTPLSISTLVGGALDWIALHLGLGTPPAAFRNGVRALAMLGALGIITWTAFRGRTGDRSAAVAAVALCAGSFVVLAPVVHLWYLLLIPAFVAPLRLSRLAMSALVGGSVVFGLVAPLDSSLHGAYEAIVLGSVLVAVLVPLLLLTRRARARIDHIAEARGLALS